MFIEKKKTFCGCICYNALSKIIYVKICLHIGNFLKSAPPKLLNKYLKYPRHNIEDSIVTAFLTDIHYFNLLYKPEL